MDARLEEHVETLRVQAAATARALRKTRDLLERFLTGPGADPTEIDALRSQSRAAMRELRTTTQLLAQAAQLHDEGTQPQEAQSHEYHHRRARVG